MEKIGLLVLGSIAPLVIDRVLDSLDDRLFRVSYTSMKNVT